MDLAAVPIVPPDATRWPLEHSAVTVPVGVAVLTAVRLIAVSRGDTATALAILHHAGAGNVLVGLLVDLLRSCSLPFLLGTARGPETRLKLVRTFEPAEARQRVA